MKECEYHDFYSCGYGGFCVCIKHGRTACSCDGNLANCDFYPEKRKETEIMNTAEMWTQAQENGKTYQLIQENVMIYYRKDKGIFDSDGHHVAIDRLGEIDTFMKRSWQETTPVLTKSEAEAKFNIKIVGK